MKIIDTETERVLVRAMSSANALLEHVTRDLAYAELTREELALCLRRLGEGNITIPDGVPVSIEFQVGGVDLAAKTHDYSAVPLEPVKGGR